MAGRNGLAGMLTMVRSTVCRREGDANCEGWRR